MNNTLKRILLILVLLVLFSAKASATDLAIQANTFDWSDSRTAGLELWIFSDQPWTDIDGTQHGAGNYRDRIFTKRVAGITNNTTTHRLSIPAFSLTPTLNAIRGNSVRLSFWIMQVVGQSVTPIKQVPGTEDGLTVPASLSSDTGCSPFQLCGSFSDLIVVNTPSPPLPRDSYYTRGDVDRLFAANAVGAPSAAKFIVNMPNGLLTNAQPLSALPTGILKNTTTTGVLSIATPGVDYLAVSGAGYVDLTTGQSIAGLKTFTNTLKAPLLDTGGMVFNLKGRGAVTDGSTNDAAIVSAALAALPTLGGTVSVKGSTGDVGISSLITIGNGSTTTVSTSHNQVIEGSSGHKLNAAGSVNPSGFKWLGASGGTMFNVAGPIGGVRFDHVLLDANNLANTAITAKGAEGLLIQDVKIIGNKGIGIDIDWFAAGDPVSSLPFDKADSPTLENVYINTINAGSTGVRVGVSSSVSKLSIRDSRFTLQGGTTTGIELGIVDQAVFSNVVTDATVGLRIKPRAGLGIYPENVFVFGSAIIGGVTIDESVQAWAPVGNRGVMFWPYATADGQMLPNDPRLWGLSDTRVFFGGGYSFRDPVTWFTGTDPLNASTFQVGATIFGSYVDVNKTGTGTQAGFGFQIGGMNAFTIDISKNIVFTNTATVASDLIVGGAAIATTATSGFFHFPTTAGVPTGVPLNTTGVPAIVDITNNRLYGYIGAGWVNLSLAGGGGGGGGTVTSVSVATANGVSGTVATATTTPAITLTLGAIVPTTVNGLTITPNGTNTLNIAAGKSLTVSNVLTLAGTDSSSIAFGTGGTVAYTANKLNVFAATSSAELAGTISDETGTGLLVLGTAPTFTTSITDPIHYGGTAAGSTLTLQGTSNGSPASAHILMNPIVAGAQHGVVSIGAPSSAFAVGDVLHLQGPDAMSSVMIFDAYGGQASFIGRRANTSSAAPSAVLSGETIAAFGARGYHSGLGFTSIGSADMVVGATENWVGSNPTTPTAVGAQITFRTTANGTATRTDQWRVAHNGHFIAATDNTVNIGASNATRPAALFLAAPAITPGSGTGITLVDSGSVRRQVYKVTVSYTAFAAAQLTQDSVIATFPAKTRIVGIVSDTTTKFIGGAVSAATLMVGKTVGGNEYILSHDVFTAAITKGLADADLGASITRAGSIQGGDLPSWTATTNLTARLTTVTAFTNALTQGSVTFYVTTEVFQ